MQTVSVRELLEIIATEHGLELSDVAEAATQITGYVPPKRRRLHTVAEAATELRCSKQYVYNLLHAGELKGYRNGKSWRISEQNIRDYLVNTKRKDKR